MRSALLALVLTGHLVALAAIETPKTAPLWEAYAKTPHTHANVPNNSFAGYAYGEKPLPIVPVVVTATEYGAVGDGKTDCTAAIMAALKAAADKGGGAVLLPAGTYNLSGPIRIWQNGVVLRGAGAGKTILYCTQSLEGALGKYAWPGGKSGWSWSGGFVWFAPVERRGDTTVVVGKGEGWQSPGAITDVRGEAKRGDTTIEVAGATGLKAGDRVLLALTDPTDHGLLKQMSGDVPGTETYDWATKAAGIVKDPVWEWPVEIAAVQGARVTLRQPLRTDVRQAWAPKLLALGPCVRDSGVEGLTLQMAPARLSAHLENPGWNGVYFESAWGCWAKDVTVRDVDNGLGTTSAKCITLDGFRIEGRKCHHATFCRVSSHDILWTRFVVAAQVEHGLNVEGQSSGNVWSAGDLEHGTFDSHRALPFESIRTDIGIFNDGGHGGAGDAGPLFGARFAHWNIRVRNGVPNMVHVENMMPRGAVVGVTGAKTFGKPYPDFDGDLGSVVESDGMAALPQDLHAAQVALRLGTTPWWLGRPIEATPHRADGKSILLTWREPFTTDRTYTVARRTERTPWIDAYATVTGPTTRFADTDVAPGERYTYRVRAQRKDGGTSEWSAEASMLNRPETVTGLTWRGEDGALRLSWQAGEETAGEVVVDRAEGDTWTAAIARVPVGQTEWRDTTVTPGARYTYRLRMTNTSGTGEASEVRSYVSAPGTVAMRETFDAKADRALPATGDGKTSLGPWLWVGQNGDKQPAIRAVDGSPTQDPPATGALCWGVVRGGARSFVRTETFSANLAGAGARVSWDMKIDGSAMATHQVALCLRLADGSWIATDAGYTPAQKGWSSREYLLADQTWFDLNPQTASLGAKVAAPDLAQVTGLGFYIDRPINNRSIWLDNVVAWGVAWGR